MRARGNCVRGGRAHGKNTVANEAASRKGGLEAHRITNWTRVAKSWSGEGLGAAGGAGSSSTVLTSAAAACFRGFGVADVAVLATCHGRRRRGCGVECDQVALDERSRLDAVVTVVGELVDVDSQPFQLVRGWNDGSEAGRVLHGIVGPTGAESSRLRPGAGARPPRPPS